jgi:hypothetical protein
MTELFRGPQGERGPKGERGPQGEQGESRLAASAEELVRSLIKAKAMPKWVGYSQGAVITVLTVVVIILVVWIIPAIRNDASHSTQYTNTVVQHECSALELISAGLPSTAPADPAQNPSRETNYKLYKAIVTWEHKDGCVPA